MKIKMKYIAEASELIERIYRGDEMSGSEWVVWALRYLEECDVVFPSATGWKVNPNVVKPCLECGELFFQKTAREKKYCSVLCKNRHCLKK